MKVKNPYLPFANYCLRIPSRSFAFLTALLETKNISTDLRNVLKNAFIREAIFLASPALFTQMEEWERDNIKDAKKIARIQNSILKYLTRMSTRCTPFGLFAGVATGKVDSEVAIEILPEDDQDRITRYDMHFLVALAKHLEKQKNIRMQLKYYPNSTFYKLGERFRYVEYSYEDKKRVHSIESVLYSDYLEGILKKANSEGATLTDFN